MSALSRFSCEHPPAVLIFKYLIVPQRLASRCNYFILHFKRSTLRNVTVFRRAEEREN